MSASVPEARAEAAPTLAALCGYFLALGTVGFGGPIALVGYMQRDLVERRRWFTPGEYKEGLALAQLAPGPLAAQLAMYLGWARGGTLGATLVGLAFVLPSFVMVVALAIAYLHYGRLAWMQGAFYGVGAAVIAIVVRSAWKLVKLTLGKDRLLWGMFAAVLAVTAATATENVWLFLLCGVAALMVRGRPGVSDLKRWLRHPAVLGGLAVAAAGGAAFVVLHGRTDLPLPKGDTGLPAWAVTGGRGPADTGTLARIGSFFTAAGAFVFGSGLAIVPFLYDGVVHRYGWLDEKTFLDAVAVAMITPGPVVITVGFIGYLVAGPAGAVVAALGTFLPCWGFVVLPAPHYRRFAGNPRLQAFVDGVTAAATGAIGGAAIILGVRAVHDGPTVAIFAAMLLLLWKVKKVPEPVWIFLAAGAGMAVHHRVGS